MLEEKQLSLNPAHLRSGVSGGSSFCPSSAGSSCMIDVLTTIIICAYKHQHKASTAVSRKARHPSNTALRPTHLFVRAFLSADPRLIEPTVMQLHAPMHSRYTSQLCFTRLNAELVSTTCRMQSLCAIVIALQVQFWEVTGGQGDKPP